MCYIDEGWDRGRFAPETATYNKIGSERRFGVELEYNEVPESVYDLEGSTVFGAKEDCSVEGGEFDSPILYGDQGLDEVHKFCGLADEYGFGVGRGAGYHLHLDMTNENADGLKRIALGYHYTKDLWLGCVPRERRHFTYSKPHEWGRRSVLANGSVSDFYDFACREDRYQWVNVYAYTSHKTFEIRCHESSIDGDTVALWAIAHTRFCDAMSEMGVGKITRVFGNKKPTETFREMRAILQNPLVSEHLKKRYSQNN